MPRTLRETAALVSLAAAPLVVPYLERLHGPLLPEQKAFLGSMLVVVGVNHRDAILDVALSLLAAPGNLLTRLTGDDDDEGEGAPPLAPLVAGGATKPTPEPAPDALAYVRCRHDRGACARQPPPEFQRVWDDALGMVPLDARERWRDTAEAEPVADLGEAPPPRPRFVGRT